MDFEFPALISPTENCPYVIVAEQKDLLESKLLTNRQICSGVPEMHKHQKLVPIEDFLKELTQNSPLSYIPSPESQQLLKEYPALKAQFENRLAQQTQNFKQLGKEMAQSYQSTCEDVVDKLTSSLKDENGALNYAFNSLQQVLKSDPEQDATIPKPREIFNKINDLKQAPELPDFLFTTQKRLRAWKDAPESLCQWNHTKETFYRDNLQQTLNQQYSLKGEIAIRFWNEQIKKLGDQLTNIIQDDRSLRRRNYVDLQIVDSTSLSLLINTMITPETRVILSFYPLSQIENYSTEDGKTIAAALGTLTSIVNLVLKWNVTGKAPGLSLISRAIQQMHQLQTLEFEFEKASVQTNTAKDFFGEFKDSAFNNLEEFVLFSVGTDLNDSVGHISKAIRAIGNENVQRVVFNLSQTRLEEKAAISLGDSLQAFKALKRLVLNLSGYSVNSNSIRDKGFEGLVQHLPRFADTLVELNLNVSRNQLTDKSVAGLSKLLQRQTWKQLKHVNFGWHYNQIQEKGAKKLGKLINSFPILVEATVNLNSTEVNFAGLEFLVNKFGPQVTASVWARQTNVKREEAGELASKVHELNV